LSAQRRQLHAADQTAVQRTPWTSRHSGTQGRTRRGRDTRSPWKTRSKSYAAQVTVIVMTDCNKPCQTRYRHIHLIIYDYTEFVLASVPLLMVTSSYTQDKATTRQPGILWGWSGCLEQSPTGHSFRTHIINVQKHAQNIFSHVHTSLNNFFRRTSSERCTASL